MLIFIKTELWKLKHYSAIWIGVAAMLSVVLLTRFMEIGSSASHTFINFSANVIWNNFTLIFPATITLLAGYIIERERTDDVLKNILVIPVSFRRLLFGKLLLVGIITIFLSILEFVFTIATAIASGFTGFETIAALKLLLQMISMNICVYVAVLPIIIFTGEKEGAFMSGVAFTFFYGFIGIFASGHGLANIYPICSGLGIINYQDGCVNGTYNRTACIIVMAMLIIISLVMLFFSKSEGKQNERNDT